MAWKRRNHKRLSTPSPIEKAPVTKVADGQKRILDDRRDSDSGSTAKMAELVAKEIYNINRGQADYMPKDGAALKLMLDNWMESHDANVCGHNRPHRKIVYHP